MENIKLLKHFTQDEVREEIKQQSKLVEDMLKSVRDSMSVVTNSFDLRILNLSNLKENINFLRRELYLIDQAMEAAVVAIDDFEQQALAPKAEPHHAPSVEGGEAPEDE